MENKIASLGFVVDRLKMGIPQAEVKQNLVAVGWSEDDADSAIMAGLLALGAPVPQRGALTLARKASSTLDVVLNFFSFILLAIVATALGVLYYQIINKFFPDPLTIRYGATSYSSGALQYAIAALIVAFPAYYFVLKLWFRRFRDGGERVESKLTKWLTYLVLLITSVTIIGDLITAIFYFLQGELSARFFLKAFVIFAIAGTIFGFYVLERRLVQYGVDVPRRIFQNFGFAIAGVVLLGIVLGFMAGGSPKTERMRGLDSQRASDLSQLANCINSFASERKRLPADLEELQSSTNYQYCASQVNDPEMGERYSYAIIQASVQSGTIREATYELCANFSLANDGKTPNGDMSYSHPDQGKWSVHDVGYSCDTERAVIENLSASAMPTPVKM